MLSEKNIDCENCASQFICRFQERARELNLQADNVGKDGTYKFPDENRIFKIDLSCQYFKGG